MTTPTSSAPPSTGRRHLKVAVAGCSHGEMDAIYGRLQEWEHAQGFKADLLICCGDYQSVRNYGDLEMMACPPKYRSLQTFHAYYSGAKLAPVLTIFVGGNHEATSYLSELPYGGWVAPNIWYMGYAGVINYKVSVNQSNNQWEQGVRIAGLSGIYKHYAFNRGRPEQVPFTDEKPNATNRSAYHVRSLDAYRLKALMRRDSDVDVTKENKVNAMFSHDWPNMITRYGDFNWLFNKKSFLRDDAERDQLGNPSAQMLIDKLRPAYYFSAHLHVRFTAVVEHEAVHPNDPSAKGTCNADHSNKNAASGQKWTPTTVPETTKFLALGKPTRQQFLEMVDIETEHDVDTLDDRLHYDETWLAVLRATDHLWSFNNTNRFLPTAPSPNGERFDFRPSDDETTAVRNIFNDDYRVPLNFRRTAPPHQAGETANQFRNQQSKNYRNPQTAEFAAKLGVLDVNRHNCESSRGEWVGECHYLTESLHDMVVTESVPAQPHVLNPDSIALCGCDSDEEPIDQDNAHFGADSADFALDRNAYKPQPSVTAPVVNDPTFVAPPFKQARTADEAHVADVEEANAQDVAAVEAGDDKRPVVGALARMKRRNAPAYETKEDSDENADYR